MEKLQVNLKELNLETAQKPLTTEELLYLLVQIIDIALEKYRNRYTKGHEKIRWGTLLVKAVEASGKIISDTDFELRLTKIEEYLNDKFKKETA